MNNLTNHRRRRTRPRAGRQLARTVGSALPKACAQNDRGSRRQGATAAGRKNLGEASGTGLGIGTAPYSRRPQKTTGMFDPIQRIKDMDLENIDTAVNFGTTVFLSLPFLENHDLACAIAHAYNTWLDGYCKTNPKRLKGVALVAMQEPKEAVKELERCVKELGFVAVATAAHSAGPQLGPSGFLSFLRQGRGARRSRVRPCRFGPAGGGGRTLR